MQLGVDKRSEGGNGGGRLCEGQRAVKALEARLALAARWRFRLTAELLPETACTLDVLPRSDAVGFGVERESDS